MLRSGEEAQQAAEAEERRETAFDGNFGDAGWLPLGLRAIAESSRVLLPGTPSYHVPRALGSTRISSSDIRKNPPPTSSSTDEFKLFGIDTDVAAKLSVSE
jgi:hypothetical protein